MWILAGWLALLGTVVAVAARLVRAEVRRRQTGHHDSWTYRPARRREW